VAVVAASFEFDLGDPEIADYWRRRIELPITTDPEGCFLAERDGRAIGVAQAIRRERLWCLSLLAVTPEAQSTGAGGALFKRALSYAAGAEGALITSSDDPRALRLYALAGFSLLPTFEASGPIDRGSLPPPHAEVRDGGPEDLEDLAPISRRIRGAPHTRELEFALSAGAQLLRLGDRGFVLVTPGQGVWLLVADDEPAATALLWSALARAGEPDRPAVRWITGEQQWAIEVALRAGLRLAPNRALAVRGRPGPLRPFLPSGPFA
jgi:GNAT superfamily N-acetyltransferase